MIRQALTDAMFDADLAIASSHSTRLVLKLAHGPVPLSELDPADLEYDHMVAERLRRDDGEVVLVLDADGHHLLDQHGSALAATNEGEPDE